MFSSEDTTNLDADFTLADLWEAGVEHLQYEIEEATGEDGSPKESYDGPIPTPGKTYEIAEGVVGEMPYPKLGIREDLAEINGRLVSPLFKDDATAEDMNALQSSDADKAAEAAKNSIADGVSAQEFNNRIQRADVEQALRILRFDEDAPDAEDVNPNMAAVVVNHFTSLRPGTTNGHATR